MKRTITFILIPLYCFLFTHTAYPQWTECNIGLVKDGLILYIHSLAVTNENTIYATSSKGLFKSTNFGNEWIQVPILFQTNWYKSTVAVSGNNLIVGCYDKVLLSTNRGMEWDMINNDINGVISKIFVNDSIIFVCARRYQTGPDTYRGGGLFVTSNLGRTWTNIKEFDFVDVNTIAVLKNRIYVGTDSRLYISNDSGYSYKKSIYFNGSIDCLLLDDNISLLGGKDGCIYKSTNEGESWVQNSTWFQVTSLCCYENNYYAGTRKYGIWVWDLGKTHFELVCEDYQEMYEINDMVIAGGYIFASTRTDGIYRVKLSELLPVGVSDKKTQFDFSIVSRIAKDDIQINIPVGMQLAVPKVIEIYDIMGERIQTTPSTSLPPLHAEGELKIDISGLVPGVYFVKIGDRVQRFVKV